MSKRRDEDEEMWLVRTEQSDKMSIAQRWPMISDQSSVGRRIGCTEHCAPLLLAIENRQSQIKVPVLKQVRVIFATVRHQSCRINNGTMSSIAVAACQDCSPETTEACLSPLEALMARHWPGHQSGIDKTTRQKTYVAGGD